MDDNEEDYRIMDGTFWYVDLWNQVNEEVEGTLQQALNINLPINLSWSRLDDKS